MVIIFPHYVPYDPRHEPEVSGEGSTDRFGRNGKVNEPATVRRDEPNQTVPNRVGEETRMVLDCEVSLRSLYTPSPSRQGPCRVSSPHHSSPLSLHPVAPFGSRVMSEKKEPSDERPSRVRPKDRATGGRERPPSRDNFWFQRSNSLFSWPEVALLPSTLFIPLGSVS